MATYNLTTGQIAAHDKTLTANTVDTVQFADDCDRIEVLGDGAAALYFRVDGNNPAVSGSNAYKLPSGAASGLVVGVPTSGGTTVTLISSGTPTYSVIRADAY